MAKPVPNDERTALAKWMIRVRLPIGEAAVILGLTRQYLQLVRDGKKIPSTALMKRIATVTRNWEKEQNYKAPRGVPASAWFDGVKG